MMANKKIISVGFQFPGDVAEFVPFRSDQSLLDADIVVFEPDISCYDTEYDDYQGKPRLTEDASFRFQEDVSHWRLELKTVVDSGRTAFIFLSELQSVYISTGEKRYSGTGRNRSVTYIVRLTDNYQSLPINIGQVVPKRGQNIQIARDLKFLTPYWKEFGSSSGFEVYLEGGIPDPILLTKTGNKVVGAVYGGKRGTFIVLPKIRYDRPSFVTLDKNGYSIWTDEAVIFGKKLASCLIEIDKVLRSGKAATPPPEWVQNPSYRMSEEAVLEAKITDLTKNIENLTNSRSELKTRLEQQGNLRRLLYETGHPLEEAILEALALLGFKAEPYRDTESEFDAVFVSPEGRFLGEAEGKDNTAVNIDKLSQLERNLQEDYARNEVTEYAKGILFGNAYRLKPLAERTEFFTEKCRSGAKRTGIALVRTPDLFEVAKYLKEHPDAAFAKQCRELLMSTQGEIVQFPPVQHDTSKASVVVSKSPSPGRLTSRGNKRSLATQAPERN